ncbi:DUF4328 domain-containing protein [Amylibacter sp. SFDW26]|uniref:DUF4328 domain-containing protein n=1 Tax=Amylibacter sp. SFDW26 TaxID=2652722 RepID=UPI0012626CFC|nr:DUF4328 domain-containing protein [Amylibacter sp. SFDW26]KAB7614533.1 DUF4328 domain-containing protein [Amylibacter sp. SFDW26]
MILKYNLDKLSNWCIGLLLLAMCLELALNIHSEFYLKLVEAFQDPEINIDISDEFIDLFDLAGVILGVGFLVIIITSAVLNLIWIYRSSFNAGILQPSEERVSPKWAVIWNFIPLLSLWKPYVAIKQTWNSTFNVNGDITRGLPMLFWFWWAAWVLNNILSNISFRISLAEDFDITRDIVIFDWIIFATTVPAYIIFIMIIHRITTKQVEIQNDLQVSGDVQ